MRCPKCDSAMEHHPNDQIAQWWCKNPRCNMLATDAWISNLTPEHVARIKKEEQDTRDFRARMLAKRESESIVQVAKTIKKRNKERQEVFESFVKNIKVKK